MVSKLLPLTQDEMQTWAEDSERFLEDLDGESWEDDVKPCSELLLSTLFERRPEITTPVIVELIAKVRPVTRMDAF